MPDLSRIYDFLKSNSDFNRSFQLRSDKALLSGLDSNKDQVIRVLYTVLETQASPRLDNIAEFWKAVCTWPEECFESLDNFISKLGGVEGCSDDRWGGLYAAVIAQNGWGPKTSALLVKHFIRIAQNNPDKKNFWGSCPVGQEALERAELYIPVDAVILRIFEEINGGVRVSFASVNEQIKKANYKGADLLLWDDLWFWGFITQNGGGANRRMEWNPSKYWCLWGTAKDEKTVTDIEEKANEFIHIITQAATAVAVVSDIELSR